MHLCTLFGTGMSGYCVQGNVEYLGYHSVLADFSTQVVARDVCLDGLLLVNNMPASMSLKLCFSSHATHSSNTVYTESAPQI